MNLRQYHAVEFTKLVFALLVVVIAMTLFIKGVSSSAVARGPNGAPGQNEEKSLDINRYANEPLELVDLKINRSSVKGKIKSKFRVPNSENWFENVKFSEKDDWFKNVQLTLRNVSDKAIFDIGVSVYFKPSGFRMLFRIPLTLTPARDLRQYPLQPREQVELQVDQERCDPMIQKMREYGVEPNQAVVSLSVDSASFGDDSGWDRGLKMHRDPKRRDKWEADSPPSPTPSAAAFEVSRMFQPAGFNFVGPTDRIARTQALTQCQQAPGGL